MNMIQVCGTYDKGNITSDNAISFDKAVKVMVTFNEEDTNVENGQLTLADFSFFKSRELLKNV